MSDEFRKILSSVPGSYDDYVNSMARDIRTDEQRKMIVDFIRKNPELNAGYVLKYYTDHFWNEEDDYEDDDMLYDDDGNEIGRYGDLVRDGKWHPD